MEDEFVDIAVDNAGGVQTVRMNGSTIFEGTLQEATVAFLGLAQLLGTKCCRRLLRQRKQFKQCDQE